MRDKTRTLAISERLWRVFQCMLAHRICLYLSVLLYSRTLTLFVVDSTSFKIEEFLHEMAISLKNGRVEQENDCFLARWHDSPWMVIVCSESWIFSLFICASVSLIRRFIAASLYFLHSLILHHYACCISACCSPKHNFRRRSLFMRVSRKKWTVPQLTAVYCIVRVPRDLDSLFCNCPVFATFSDWFLFLAL